MPALRKIFAFCLVIGAMRGEDLVQGAGETVANSNTDEEELQALRKVLHLDQDDISLVEDGDQFSQLQDSYDRW